MAAVFYSPSEGRSIFKGNFQAFTSISIPKFNDLVGVNAMSIITDVSIENNETIQYFLTFDDVVHYFYFGKGLGNITIRGMMFMNCAGNTPGFNKFYNIIGNNRGRQIDISIAGVPAFKAVITNFGHSTTSDPVPVTEFQISLAIVSQPGLARPRFNVPCTETSSPNISNNTDVGTTEGTVSTFPPEAGGLIRDTVPPEAGGLIFEDRLIRDRLIR